jgi:Tol biopolymer transport system component
MCPNFRLNYDYKNNFLFDDRNKNLIKGDLSMNFRSSKSHLSLIVLFILMILITAQIKAQTDTIKQEGKEFRVWKVPNVSNGAEFYFSPDAKSMIGNAKFEGDSSHQVYTMKIDGTDIKRINAIGEDACSYYFPDGERLIWTSTRDNLDLPKGDWSNAKDYPKGAELYISDLKGENVVRLTHNKYYDAEVSVSPDGKKILFTRQIDGKCDLWVMNSDGTNEHQVTFTDEWQEGGSFYLNDNETIIYRAWLRKDDGKRGTPMTIFTVKDNGADLKQITHEEGTNWAPHPAPDGDHFVFVKVLPPFNFEIFLMSIKTGEQLRLTYNDAFDGFPVISPDGKLLTFSSNRDEAKGVRKLSPYLMDISFLNLCPKD